MTEPPSSKPRIALIHRQSYPVTMESVDAVGIVFYAAYWIWYEGVFEAFIAAASGRSWRSLVESGFVMPIVHAEIDYLQPLRLSEVVIAEIRLSGIGSRSIRFEAEFSREDEVVARTRTVHVAATSGKLEAVEIPSWLRRAADERGDSRPSGQEIAG